MLGGAIILNFVKDDEYDGNLTFQIVSTVWALWQRSVV